MVRMVIRVPRSLKGHLRHIAFDQQYTVERLAAQALAEYAARETARNGAAA
jgi:predicted transcriptional regulator